MGRQLLTPIEWRRCWRRWPLTLPNGKPTRTLDSDDLGPLPRTSISVKPTALAPKIKRSTRDAGLEQAKARLRPILVLQRRTVLAVVRHGALRSKRPSRFADAPRTEPEFKDVEAGLVMQAYLRDTYGDLAKLITWSAGRARPDLIRLVKGAYWDTETVYAQQARLASAGFQSQSRKRRDLPGRSAPAFCSTTTVMYGPPLFPTTYARWRTPFCTLARALPQHTFEVQMLYGMAEPMHEAIRKYGLRLRVYAPVGELVPGMAYLVRRLLENPQTTVSFACVLRQRTRSTLSAANGRSHPQRQPTCRKVRNKRSKLDALRTRACFGMGANGPQQAVAAAVAAGAAQTKPEYVSHSCRRAQSVDRDFPSRRSIRHPLKFWWPNKHLAQATT